MLIISETQIVKKQRNRKQTFQWSNSQFCTFKQSWSTALFNKGKWNYEGIEMNTKFIRLLKKKMFSFHITVN